jgi:hypothetical protein
MSFMQKWNFLMKAIEKTKAEELVDAEAGGKFQALGEPPI